MSNTWRNHKSIPIYFPYQETEYRFVSPISASALERTEINN